MITKRLLLPLGALLGLGTASLAAVLTNPAQVSGSNAIDPVSPDANAGARDQNITVTGAPTKLELTALSGFGAVQTFTGFTGASGTSTNYLDFSSLPDVQLLSFSYNGSGGGASANFASSGSSSQFVGSGGYNGSDTNDWFSNTTNNLGQKITFGTYDAGGSSFTANQSVGAVGFMLTQNDNVVARTWTVAYFDVSNALLAQQNASASGGSAALFGLIRSQQDIHRIEVAITGGGDAGTFMDDFGFAVVPEPATVAVLMGLACLGLALWRRRRA